MHSSGLGEQVSIVAAGARGKGRFVAAALAEAGPDVAIADVLPEAAAEAATHVSARTERRVEAVRTDVTRLDDAHYLCETALARFGRIDVLVNSVGWDRLTPFLETSPDL